MCRTLGTQVEEQYPSLLLKNSFYNLRKAQRSSTYRLHETSDVYDTFLFFNDVHVEAIKAILAIIEVHDGYTVPIIRPPSKPITKARLAEQKKTSTH